MVKRAEAIVSVEEDQRQEEVNLDSKLGVMSAKAAEAAEETPKPTEEQKTKVKEKAKPQPLEQMAGLYTIETGLNQQVITKLKLSDEDKELVSAALDVLAEVIERKITNESTKRYISLLLVFIRSVLSTQV